MTKTIFQKTWIKLSALFVIFILISPIIIFLTPEISQAEGGFALLENYPGLGASEIKIITGSDSSAALGTYVDWIVKFSLGLLSIGAVIALVYAGITYIGSETFSKKSDAKDLIVRSVGALVLMFSAFIFFDQLNPELLKVRFKPITTTELGIKKAQINSISDIWDKNNFANYYDELYAVTKNYKEGGIFDGEACGTESYIKKNKISTDLGSYLSTVKKLKSEGRKTVVVDDFTETDPNKWANFEAKYQYCDDIYNNWEKSWLTLGSNILIGGVTWVAGKSTDISDIEKRDGYINNVIYDGFFSSIVASNDDCVLISTYEKQVGGIYEKAKKAYDSCSKKINNNPLITDWDIYTRSFDEEWICQSARETIEHKKTKKCFEQGGVWLFKIEK